MDFKNSSLTLHNGQGPPNKLKNIYKPIYFIKICLFYGNIFIFYSIQHVNNILKGFKKL